MIEVLKQALEALGLLVEERSSEAMDDGYNAITSLRQAIAELESQGKIMKVEGPLHVVCQCDKCKTESQEPVAWKLMPRDATDAMLKAMDECSNEGYDERLYAGHAASVYMAAWDASDTHPPQLEQNFCPRCGKRTNDIHTCTPPRG
jgi:hypothetical protein